MQAGKGQDTVTQQEVPSNILPDPKSEVLKPQEVFAAGGQKGAGAVTIGLTGESELVTEAHPATVPTDGDGVQPGDGDGCWLGGARAVYSEHREQSTAMTQEPGRGTAQGGSWNSV